MHYSFFQRLSLSILALFCGCVFATSTIAAEAEPALPLKPAELVHIGKFAITNSMLVTWIVAAGIIVFAQLATRKIKPIPSGIQNFWEWLVEGLYNLLESIIGRDLVKKTFWFFATIFIFILFVNWFGLIPGVGTIGWGHYDPATGIFHVDQPLLRGGNADLNMTTAMAAIFFVLWFVWAIQANGVGGFLLHLFGPKGESSGIVKSAHGDHLLRGWLARSDFDFVSPDRAQFSIVRKYLCGREYSGSDVNMVPILSPFLPIPFYFLEVLVGFVQALVFMLLTAVFTMLIAQHEGQRSVHTA